MIKVRLTAMEQTDIMPPMLGMPMRWNANSRKLTLITSLKKAIFPMRMLLKRFILPRLNASEKLIYWSIMPQIAIATDLIPLKKSLTIFVSTPVKPTGFFVFCPTIYPQKLPGGVSCGYGIENGVLHAMLLA